MADTIVNKSIRSVDDTHEFILSHAGQASYVQVAGAGADVPSAGPGLNKGTLQVIGGIDSSKTYVVYPVPPANASLPLLNTVKLMWVVISTGAEVAAAVDLSGKYVRLLCKTV